MKNCLIILVLISFCFANSFTLVSCHQKKENNKPIPVNMTDTIISGKEITNEPLNEQVGDTIQLLVQDDKGIYSAIGVRDSLHPRIYVKFNNKDISLLKATVKPLIGDGNLRINQIIFPDKTMDGPFGKELEQELKTSGEHLLVIGISQMADNPYIGKFKVEVQLTAKSQ